MIDELIEMDPEHKDDPILTREVWMPLLLEFLEEEMERDPGQIDQFDSAWLQQNDPELFTRIKVKTAQILNLGNARGSLVMKLVREWRALLTRANFKKRGAFVRFPSGQAESIQTFFEKYKESQKAVRTYRALLKQDKGAEAERYFKQNRDAVENSKGFFEAAQALKTYQETIRGLWKDKTLLPDQKRKAIELVYVEMIDLARKMLEELYPVESR